jgi:TonB family protein
MRIASLCLALILLGIADNSVSFAGPARQDANQTREKIYQPEEVDRKAKIIKKSEPRYTEQARRNHTSGWVVLRVVLKSSGEIGDIKVIKDLPDGLTEECIRVAREMKFEPAMKDGNPVSQYTRVEYTFSVD